MRRYVFTLLVAGGLFVLCPTTAHAQTVVNPHFVDFTVSPDHGATKLDGSPVVTRYEMVSVAMNATGAMVWTFDLGKPTPTSTGLASVPLPATLPIPTETLYTATVRAIGPDGTSPASPPSNPFGVAGTKLPAAANNVKVR